MGADPFRDEDEKFVRKFEHLPLLLHPQNGQPGFERRFRDLRRHPGLKPGDQTRLQSLDFRRLFIGSHHDLFARIVNRVERVEEFLLQLFLAAEMVYIVDQKKIHVAVIIAEFRTGLVAQGIHVVIQESFAGRVADDRIRVHCLHIICNRLHQMSLAEAGSSVNVKGIEGAGRSRGCLRGGKRIAVFLSDYKIFKRVSGIAVRCGLLHFLYGSLYRFGGFRCFDRNRLFFHGLAVTGFNHEFQIAASRFPNGICQNIPEIIGQPFSEEVIGNPQQQGGFVDGQGDDHIKPLIVGIFTDFALEYGGRLSPQLPYIVQSIFCCHFLRLFPLLAQVIDIAGSFPEKTLYPATSKKFFFFFF